MDIVLFGVCILSLYKAKFFGGGYNKEYISKESTTAVNGIFVLLVFLRHFRQYIELGRFDSIFNIVDYIMGQLIVVTFLFYSGYGIMTSIKSKGRNYIFSMPYNRLFKIWLHFSAAILLFLITGFIVKAYYSVFDILLSFTGWKSVGNSNWYVFCILMLYLFTFISFAVMSKSQSKNRHIISVGLTVMFCVIYIVVLHSQKQIWWYNTIIAYPIGMLYSICEGKMKNFVQKNNGVYFTACLIVLAVFMILMTLNFFGKSNFIGYECLVIAFIALVLLVSMKFSIKNRALIWLGGYTFEIYILQRIPMILLQEYIGNKYVYFILCLVMTLLLAVLFRRFTDVIDAKLFNKKIGIKEEVKAA